MPDSTNTAPPSRAVLVRAWQRAQMHVRCGLSVERPSWVRVYLQAGMQLARRGMRPAVSVHLQMLRTLLLSAEDEALPWFWRSVCLEHVNLPLAQLTSALGHHDPVALRAIEAAVQRARDRLPHAASLVRAEPDGHAVRGVGLRPSAR